MGPRAGLDGGGGNLAPTGIRSPDRPARNEGIPYNTKYFKLNVCQVFRKFYLGARGGVVVKALRYIPAGRGFDSRWCHWNFSVT